ncbi:hypothetical protein [Kocuria rosea]|uniref:hypothetical protein n=1 Tax=Kocuria rosea TaxID=1275 RepID=UPI003D34865E
MTTHRRHPINKRVMYRAPQPPRTRSEWERTLKGFSNLIRAVSVYEQALTRAFLHMAEALAPIVRQIAESTAATGRAAHRQALTEARATRTHQETSHD